MVKEFWRNLIKVLVAIRVLRRDEATQGTSHTPAPVLLSFFYKINKTI
jgi:hypothetical protein